MNARCLLVDSKESATLRRVSPFAVAVHGVGLASAMTLARPAAGLSAQVECVDPRVRVQAQPDARWFDAIAAACESTTHAPDSDPNARVRLVPAERDLLVEVVLKDGRATSRRVSATERLGPTLDALLTVLPPSPAPANTSTSTSTTAPSPPGADDPHERPPVEPSPAPRAVTTVVEAPFGVDVGAGLASRVSGSEGYMSFAVDAFGELRLGRLLIGMAARWDMFEGPVAKAPPLNLEMQTVALGLLMGRRFAPSFGNVDLGITPRFIVELQAYDSLTSEQEKNDSATDIRVGAFGRLALGHGAFRPFAELDAELSPARIRRSIHIDPVLPPLPAWSTGLSLGVMWSDK